MTDLVAFTACLWEITALRREEVEDIRRTARLWHAAGGVVETCQRAEAFTFSQCACPAPNRLAGLEAVEHLASLAAGVESAALGEHQVLGQVRSGIAPLRARAPWLDAVIASARQLRAEAGFAVGTGHLLDRALDLAGVAAKGSLLVIGAGAAGRDIARRAGALGFETVTVASRKPWTSEGVTWIPFEAVARTARQDVVVACLAATAGEMGPHQLPQSGLYVDLGSPASLAAGVTPAVTLNAIVESARLDCAETTRRAALRRRLAEVLAVRLASFDAGQSPVARMRRDVEALRAREAARIAKLHPGLPPATIEAVTHGLVNQLLHAPSERLRNLQDPALAAALADLFRPSKAIR